MPGRTWRDLRRDPGGSERTSSQLLKEESITAARQTSPRLDRLLEERKKLENRLRDITSGSGEELAPRDAARFQVPSFAKRQAQQRAWEEKREKLQASSAELRRQARDNQNAKRGDDLPGLSDPQESVNQWLQQRDAQRNRLREGARDRLAPLNDVSRIGKQISGSLSRASTQLRNLDRQLAEQGLTKEREEISSVGKGKLSKARSQIDKYTAMADAPMRAVKKIDKFWQNRQRDISGAMDKRGPYVDRSRRRLSTTTGGSGDLFERMERNRKFALERRKEKRREEARDEARRERSRRKKKGVTRMSNQT